MENRKNRLAALNGESRVFVCADCGKVKHVKDAGMRVGHTADIVCVSCVMALWLAEHADRLMGDFLRAGLLSRSLAQTRVSPFSDKRLALFSTPHRESNHYEQLFNDPPIWEKDCNAQWRDQQYKK